MGLPPKNSEALLLAPNIDWVDVPKQFALNDPLELKTEGVGPNVGKLDIHEEGSDLLGPNNPEAEGFPDGNGVDDDVVAKGHADA